MLVFYCVLAVTIMSMVEAFQNRIILVRHAEKGWSSSSPEHKIGRPPGKMPWGLSDVGKERAQCLRSVFGNSSDFDVGLIFAAPRSGEDRQEERTYATVAPLAADLGLDIEVSCAEAPFDCIVERVDRFANGSSKDILISWKHFDLNLIATALGASNARTVYPMRRYDIIWLMYDGAVREKTSQHCPSIDDDRDDDEDPDLQVEPFGDVRAAQKVFNGFS